MLRDAILSLVRYSTSSFVLNLVCKQQIEFQRGYSETALHKDKTKSSILTIKLPNSSYPRQDALDKAIHL